MVKYIQKFMIKTKFKTNISGIYQIKNLLNGKIYIGSSINCSSRYRKHFNDLLKNKHVNKILQNSWNKHKPFNFEFSIIEEISDKDKLINREQYYIDVLKPNYNICKIAGNTLGRKISNETKNKIKTSLLDKFSGENSFNYKGGYIKPKNKLEKKDNIERILTRSSRQANTNGKKILQFDYNMNLINKWNSIKSAADLLKIQRHAIKKCCEGYARHAGFFIWRYEGNEKIIFEYRKNKIYQIDDDNNIINEFNQIVVAAETLKINRKSISKALKSGEKYCGFYWKYKIN